MGAELGTCIFLPETPNLRKSMATGLGEAFGAPEMATYPIAERGSEIGRMAILVRPRQDVRMVYFGYSPILPMQFC